MVPNRGERPFTGGVQAITLNQNVSLVTFTWFPRSIAWRKKFFKILKIEKITLVRWMNFSAGDRYNHSIGGKSPREEQTELACIYERYARVPHAPPWNASG